MARPMTIEEQMELHRRSEEIISRVLGNEGLMRQIRESMEEPEGQGTPLREIQAQERAAREREQRK